MNSLNTNEKFWFNLEDHGAGRIFVTIAGKKTPLRYTLHQQEQLNAFFELQKQPTENAESGDTPTGQNLLARSYQQDAAVCVIALNPQPNKVDFTMEDIESNLDIDQVKLLAGFWLTKKVFSPTMAGETGRGK
jgi:sugar diacid utilization regulator